MRNEAHRFAITFHRDLRSKNFLVSEIIQVKGLGPKTYETLMFHFKSVSKMKEASLDELSAVIGNKKAEILMGHFLGGE